MQRTHAPINGIIAWRPQFLQPPGAWLITAKFDRCHPGIPSLAGEVMKADLLDGLRSSRFSSPKLVGDNTAMYLLGPTQQDADAVLRHIAWYMPSTQADYVSIDWRIPRFVYDGVITRESAGPLSGGGTNYHWTFSLNDGHGYVSVDQALSLVPLSSLLYDVSGRSPELSRNENSYRVSNAPSINIDQLLAHLNYSFDRHGPSGLPVHWRVTLPPGENRPKGWKKLGRQ